MTAKMPKIVVPEQPVWGDNGLQPVSSQKKSEIIIDEKSYWILGGGIVLFVIALVVIFVSSILCW